MKIRRHKGLLKLCWAAVLTLSLGLSEAATVYRCGPEGRLLTDQPCSQAAPISYADRTSPERVREAQQVIEREQALASKLKAERLERERSTRPAGASGIRHAAAAQASVVSAGEAGTLDGPRKPKSSTKGQRRAQPKDPRVSFEVKQSAPKREPAARQSKARAKP